MNTKATKGISKTRKPLWKFCLYVANQTPRSVQALNNLNDFCKREFPGRYAIKVVDVLAKPHLALKENIVAVPTLVRVAPAPMRRVIGNLTDRSRMILGLDLRLSA